MNATMYKVITMEALLRTQANRMYAEASNYRKAAMVIENPGHMDRLNAKADALDTWAGKIMASVGDLTQEQREQNIEVDANF